MSETIGKIMGSGINKVIQSAAGHMKPENRDEILGSVLARFTKGGTGKTLLELACYSDGLRVLFDTLLADGKITNKEIDICKDYLDLAASQLAKVRNQYAAYANLSVSEIVPFLKQYRDDTGAFGYKDAATKWAGIQICENISRLKGDGNALKLLREVLQQAAKALVMVDGVEEKELEYLKKLSIEIGSGSTSTSSKTASGQSAGEWQKVIKADFASLEKSTSSPEWIDQNLSHLRVWQQAAKENDARGQVIMGLCHDYGKGVPEDKKTAFRLYQLAAKQGLPRAQYNLGVCYEDGEGVEEDKEEAFRWWKLAADQGLARAQYNLGNAYLNGEGVEEDKEEAFRWWKLAADQGLVEAQYNLGLCYAFGEGVDEDKEEAVRWFRLAADQGVAEAQIKLGICYFNGDGVEEDKEEAFRWFRLAADQGLANAQVFLGICYVNGDGVEEDKEEAFRWFRLAADQGNAEAQCNLGVCYVNGDGVEEDKKEAFRWFKLAADQGFAIAQLNLGNAYLNGDGVEEDKEEAFRWFKLSADQGDADAQFNLGHCYDLGNGIKEDKEKAAQWYKLAVEQGHELAQTFLKILENAGVDDDDDENSDSDSNSDWDSDSDSDSNSNSDWEIINEDEDDEFQCSEEDEKPVGKYDSMLEKIESGKHLDKTDVRSFMEYLHGCNDGEDAYMELKIKVLTDQVAKLISEWSPVCNCGAVIYMDIESISDTAASLISKWSSHDGTVYELQLTKLKDISILGAKSLLNSNLHLRINTNNFSKSVLKILLRREIQQDFGEGKLLLEPLNEDSGSEEYDDDFEQKLTPADLEFDDDEDDDSGNAGSQSWPVHSVRFSESELVDPPGTVINSLGMKFVPIKAGKFMMGGREDEEGYNEEEEHLHLVQITKPFLLGMFAVTQSDYVKVMGSNPSVFHGKTRPVEHVTWKQAVDFCKRLSEMPAEKAASRMYRLPTEAEWEYACRAGTETAYAFGDDLTALQANFCQENVSVPQPTLPVGMYPPNAWGLYDMHGNVWEWCSDWYGLDYYSTSPAMDPKGPAKGTHHVLRGGSASVMGYECRSAIRGESSHDGPFPNGSARFESIGDFGLRVVCEFRK